MIGEGFRLYVRHSTQTETLRISSINENLINNDVHLKARLLLVIIILYRASNFTSVSQLEKIPYITAINNSGQTSPEQVVIIGVLGTCRIFRGSR